LEDGGVMNIQVDVVYRPQTDKVGRVPEWCIQIIRNRLERRFRGRRVLSDFLFETINARLVEGRGKRLGTIFDRDAGRDAEFKAHLCSLVSIAQLKEHYRFIVPSNPFYTYYQAHTTYQGFWKNIPDEAAARESFNKQIYPSELTDTTSVLFTTNGTGRIFASNLAYPEYYAVFDTQSVQPFKYVDRYDDQFVKFCLTEWLKWSELDVQP
jgi:hypothetical protein